LTSFGLAMSANVRIPTPIASKRARPLSPYLFSHARSRAIECIPGLVHSHGNECPSGHRDTTTASIARRGLDVYLSLPCPAPAGSATPPCCCPGSPSLGAASGQAGADQAGLVGDDDQLGPVSRAELGHRPVDVGLGGQRAHEQGRGD